MVIYCRGILRFVHTSIDFYSGDNWPGKMNDTNIMKEILYESDTHNATAIVKMIKFNDCLMLCDRGFRDFESHVNANRARFPRLKVVLPVSEVDGSNRNSRQAADRSRLEVTSIKWIVEALHGQQKN